MVGLLKIGDRIKFKATTRSGSRTVWRKITGFYGNTNLPTVRYDGWNNFLVYHHEILDVEYAT